jgi:NAD(P)H-dependent FMN reductase
VGYGGVSGGTRSIQMSKLLVTSLKMMAIPEGVFLPFVAKLVNAEGNFDPGTTQDEAAKRMLDELARWTGALASLRAPA